MLKFRRAEERGITKVGWLDSRHTFSFGDYRDPGHVNFGPLRVINEDRITGGSGFAPHPHRDMEIVTYIVSGALEHKDSLGTGSVIRPGEIQRMSAGSGIVHSEFNASPSEPCHFLQIWIMPSKTGIAPSYEQKAIDAVAATNKFTRIAAPDPRESEVRLVQDAEIWVSRIDAGEEAIHVLAQGRRAWIHVVRGEVKIRGETLRSGDAASTQEDGPLALRAQKASEILLFDMT